MTCPGITLTDADRLRVSKREAGVGAYVPIGERRFREVYMEASQYTPACISIDGDTMDNRSKHYTAIGCRYHDRKGGQTGQRNM